TNGLAAKFADRAGVIFEHARAQAGFVARIGDGLANVQCFKLSDLLEVFTQDARDVEKNLGALTGSEVTPAGFPGLMSGFDGGVGVLNIGGRDLGECFFSGWINKGRSMTGTRVVPGGIDKKLCWQTRGFHSTS